MSEIFLGSTDIILTLSILFELNVHCISLIEFELHSHGVTENLLVQQNLKNSISHKEHIKKLLLHFLSPIYYFITGRFVEA